MRLNKTNGSLSVGKLYLAPSFLRSEILELSKQFNVGKISPTPERRKRWKRDGERLTYLKGRVFQKAYFKDGLKNGVGEEYNSKGELTGKITYDEGGNLIKEEKL